MITTSTGKGVYPPLPAENACINFLKQPLLFRFHKGEDIRIAGNIGD